MAEIQVSIVIVNYNTRVMTQECIDSIINHTKEISYEIILIDNRSQDDSKEFFEKDSRIRYVYSLENLGFGRANNVGMMLAKGDYVFLLNSDTLLVNNAIKMFYDYAESHRELKAFFGGWLMNRNKEYIHSYADVTTMHSLLKNALASYRNLVCNDKALSVLECYNRSGDAMEVGYVTGADLFFHRSVFEEYGAFDHHFFMYYEECDWQWRMKLHGLKSVVIKGPEILHLCGEQNGETKKARSIKVKIMNLESLKYYLKKHYNILQYFLFRGAFFFLKFFPVIVDRRYYTLKDRIKYLWVLAK